MHTTFRVDNNDVAMAASILNGAVLPDSVEGSLVRQPKDPQKKMAEPALAREVSVEYPSFVGEGAPLANPWLSLTVSQKRLKILLYSANFAPEPTGIGKYSGEMADWLTAHGHEVRVVCAPPYYPSWRLADGYAWPPYRHEERKGARVWRCPLWIPKHPGGLARILHLLTFSISSMPIMLRQIVWRPDVVMTVAPAFTCAPVGWLTARLSGARAWLHIQDFEIDVAFQMGLLKNRFLKSLMLGAERWLMRRFDQVSSISGRMIDRLRQKGVEPERVRFFPNWVDTRKVRPLESVSTYRLELKIPQETVVVLFSGTLGGKQGLLVIPEAAKLLAHRKDIVFVVCGDGVMKPLLSKAAQELPNLRLLPLQPMERLSDLLGMADIHLLPQSPDAADLVMPSKLSGMLASGKPVIATCREGTEIADVVNQCGTVVPPEDGAALAAAIEELASDSSRRLGLGVAARQYAENNLACDAVLARMLSQLY